MKNNKRIKNYILECDRNKGFTLVETIVAVFILTISLAALLNLISTSLDAFKYSRDEVTANYLIQEVVDSVRNNRDSTAFLDTTSTGGWTNFLNMYGYNDGGSGKACFQNGILTGCTIDPLEAVKSGGSGMQACIGNCTPLSFDSNASTGAAFYSSGGSPSGFKRIVKMSVPTATNLNELDVTVFVTWSGHTRSLNFSLLNWAN